MESNKCKIKVHLSVGDLYVCVCVCVCVCLFVYLFWGVL